MTGQKRQRLVLQLKNALCARVLFGNFRTYHSPFLHPQFQDIWICRSIHLKNNIANDTALFDEFMGLDNLSERQAGRNIMEQAIFFQ